MKSKSGKGGGKKPTRDPSKQSRKREGKKRDAKTPGMGDFIVSVATDGGTDEGARLVREQARHEFNAEHGPALAKAEQDVRDHEARLAGIDAERAATSAERRGTAEWVLASSKKGKREDKDAAEIPFRQWSLIDQAIFAGCALLAVVMLFAGVANIQANLANSGLPVFTLNPGFAWLFAALSPAAAMAIHTFGHAFRTWGARQRYVKAIYGLTALSVVAWSLLFAKLFHGTGGLDLSLDEGSLADTLFAWLQVTTEILVGSSLFLTCEHIAAKYSPNWLVRNRIYSELRERELALDAERERLVPLAVEARGQLTSLESRREAAINRAYADYLQRHRRFES